MELPREIPLNDERETKRWRLSSSTLNFSQHMCILTAICDCVHCGNTPSVFSLLCSTAVALTGELVYTPRDINTISLPQLYGRTHQRTTITHNLSTAISPQHECDMYTLYLPSDCTQLLPCLWIVTTSRETLIHKLSGTLPPSATLPSFLRWTIEWNFLPIICMKVTNVSFLMPVEGKCLILSDFEVPHAKLQPMPCTLNTNTVRLK